MSAASEDLRDYVSAKARRLLSQSRLLDGLAAALPPDDASQLRAAAVILPALRALADAS